MISAPSWGKPHTYRKSRCCPFLREASRYPSPYGSAHAMLLAWCPHPLTSSSYMPRMCASRPSMCAVIGPRSSISCCRRWSRTNLHTYVVAPVLARLYRGWLAKICFTLLHAKAQVSEEIPCEKQFFPKRATLND